MGETNVKVVCEDNGKGFDTEALQEPGFTGLKVIKDRVEMLAGKKISSLSYIGIL
jgi:signal transduction histidine kinase